MKTNLISKLSCPTCQNKLMVSSVLVDPTYSQNKTELAEGLMQCTNCKKNYPVLNGVAIILPNTNSWLRNNYYYIAEGIFTAGSLSQPIKQYLDQQGWRMSSAPANNYYELPRWVDIFLSTHYDPTPAGADDDSNLGKLISSQPSVFDFVAHTLKQHTLSADSRALDVGTNVGGMAYRLAESVNEVVAIDTAYNPILAARKIQLGLPEKQRTIRRYIDGLQHEEINIGPFPDNVEFLVASIFDLPIEGQFDVISALNVIDVVPDPEGFINIMIDRLNLNGLLIITSPYSWGSDDVPIDNWLGDKNTSSSKALINLLKEKNLEIEDEADCIPWVLREHRRWYRVFHNHCVIARKV